MTDFHASLDAALAKQPTQDLPAAAAPTTEGGEDVAAGILLPGARIPTILAALFVLTVAVVFVGAVVAGGVG
jgi:hypothetical protein